MQRRALAERVWSPRALRPPVKFWIVVLVGAAPLCVLCGSTAESGLILPIAREVEADPAYRGDALPFQQLATFRFKGEVHVEHARPRFLGRRHIAVTNDRVGAYLAFLGRLSPEKRCDRAIEIARRAGLPLKIAGKVDASDREYFRSTVEPLLGKGVEFVGEIGDKGKSDFLGGALALLFPIDWPEPFGLVMVESFACGTPVVAWRNGSVPEIMEEGVTGWVVDSLDEAVRAVERAASLDRRGCRAVFDARFTVPRMLSGYLTLYEAAASRSKRWTRSSA